jgi:hypothetical protein
VTRFSRLILLIKVLDHGIASVSRCATNRSFVPPAFGIGDKFYICFLTSIHYPLFDVEHTVDCSGDAADDGSCTDGSVLDIV